MGKQVLEIEVRVKDQASGQTQKIKGNFQDMEKGLSQINQALATFGLALGAKEVFEFAQASAEAARVQKDALNTLIAASKGVADYREAMRLAKEQTRGMTDQAQLANTMATLFGASLATTAEEAAQLASAGAILTGVFESAGASQEMFVRLLSSGSPVLFNNFGLTNQMVQAKQREIEATTQLRGEEAKMQAVKQALIENAQKYQGALSQDTIAAQQLQAATTDLQAAIDPVPPYLLLRWAAKPCQ